MVDPKETLYAIATLLCFGLGFFLGWYEDWLIKRDAPYDDGGCGI